MPGRPPPAPFGPPPQGRLPLHTVLVLGAAGTATGAHVRSLAAGLAARGVRVTVCAPHEAERRHGFTAAGAHFAAVPGQGGAQALAVLRAVSADADLVHAHGLRAGALASLALPARRRVPLVVTWHARGQAEGVRASLTRMLERRVVRAAHVVLGASTDLVDRARHRGARDARLAPVAVCDGEAADGTGGGDRAAQSPRHKARADLGAVERPLVFALGRPGPHQGHGTLLTAARAWRHLDPQPLVVIAGDGRGRAALRQRIDEEGLPVRLLDHAEAALRLPAAADVAVLCGRGAARPLGVQETLRAGVPLVAARVGSVRELAGDAAVLVPRGDAEALADAVAALLADPARRARLAAAGRAQAAAWPSEDATVAQVLSVYDELARRG
ncbi:glycosyltransferase family 4 protein [Streptomyces sp. TRM 70351]|uniref:glycosyltransferase family 4 protein n=1 Tax=Streptomyces sp. TRM 70351 TaxID=3116552 RepID=UPI002E7C09BC|nr:glycosyltransferase family 4 protein [Streptomyces sp. TRM 70351]MEE1929292.1 glycosyltransferase family 4 protein [Streptomyces sp. TRM 70351]